MLRLELTKVSLNSGLHIPPRINSLQKMDEREAAFQRKQRNLLWALRPQGLAILDSAKSEPVGPYEQEHLKWETNREIPGPRGVSSELNSMDRGIDIQRRSKYQKSTDCQAGRPEAGTDKNSSSQDQLEYAARTLNGERYPQTRQRLLTLENIKGGTHNARLCASGDASKQSGREN